jgi:Kef-type K+ transport system membrane component KefB
VILAIVVTLVAVATKFVGGGLGAWGMSRREMAQVGVGMIPRGEVGIVVAQIGLGMAAISEQFFAAVLFMAVATTLIAPPLIKLGFAEYRNKDGMADEFIPDEKAEEYSRIG